jgi:glycosyltransferase involved in cell wall biosynthesis
MIEASVIIATRDRAGFLRDCLASLAGQTAAGRFEVIVVDNGSSDDTSTVIAKAKETAALSLRSIAVPEPNRARARNAGLAQARGPIAIFCDDDTIAPPGYIAAHLSAHTVGGRVVSGPIVNVISPALLAPVRPRHYSRAFFCTCNASVSTDAIQAVGAFDEGFKLYGWEDTEVGVHLRNAKLAQYFAWDAVIYHVKPPETTTLDRLTALAREKGEMAARFVKKSPTVAVRLATGAYMANFARAALVNAPPLRSLYASIARRAGTETATVRFAREALVDAAYVDALRANLRRRDG